MHGSTKRRLLGRLVAGAASAVLTACGGGGGGGGTQGFHVQSVSPPNGAVAVATDAHVIVTFSDTVDPASMNATAVSVGLPGTGAVSGALIFASPSSLEFVPGRDLETSTTYAVQVSPSLRSTTGQPLQGTLSFLFRTASTGSGGVILPTADQLRPANGVLFTGRRNHTATLLPSGYVFIAGGISMGTTVTDTAELYNPLSEQFSKITSKMQHPREGHVAVRLANGRVLLAGGWYEISSGTLNAHASAEIFDPSSNSFSDTGSMSVGRGDAAGHLLPDGRVLVTGGTRPVGNGFEDFLTAEVYDPATGVWAPWPVEMGHTHTTHTATDLTDGRFLIAGGFEPPFEIFDTSTGLFSDLPPPPASPRASVRAPRRLTTATSWSAAATTWARSRTSSGSGRP